ncbi:hypothetical protein FLONG3_9789 [Fusarium longipes]|uniref:Uncharacterized protein n=1 Tax=Fusarium longipes TaxID=694270 RepID=A0A395RUN4_9HYPO|nr:hypothetical protein FLONG3_9789 [Fusarium longipes]
MDSIASIPEQPSSAQLGQLCSHNTTSTRQHSTDSVALGYPLPHLFGPLALHSAASALLLLSPTSTSAPTPTPTIPSLPLGILFSSALDTCRPFNTIPYLTPSIVPIDSSPQILSCQLNSTKKLFLDDRSFIDHGGEILLDPTAAPTKRRYPTTPPPSTHSPPYLASLCLA